MIGNKRSVLALRNHKQYLPCSHTVQASFSQGNRTGALIATKHSRRGTSALAKRADEPTGVE